MRFRCDCSPSAPFARLRLNSSTCTKWPRTTITMTKKVGILIGALGCVGCRNTCVDRTDLATPSLRHERWARQAISASATSANTRLPRLATVLRGRTISPTRAASASMLFPMIPRSVLLAPAIFRALTAATTWNACAARAFAGSAGKVLRTTIPITLWMGSLGTRACGSGATMAVEVAVDADDWYGNFSGT